MLPSFTLFLVVLLVSSSITLATRLKLDQSHVIRRRAIEKGLAHAPAPAQPANPTAEGLMNSQQNDATAAILRSNNAFLLFGIKEHTNVSKHWILIQKANKILKTACTSLDRTLQDSMVRMFRYLYARFTDSWYVPQEFLGSESRLETVTGLLEKCFAETKKIEFKYGPENACANDKRVVEATIIGKTIQFTAENLTLPPNETFSKAKHDVQIESIWKMITFVHYYCSEYFFSNAFEHSAWVQMALGFLGADIIYRWHHPQVANKGFYASFNSKNMLDQYTQGLDACVAIAKKIAAFPLWIQRPGAKAGKDKETTGMKNKLKNFGGESG